jgi:hypothetical protein
MNGFVNTVDLLGDDVVLKSILEKSITEFNDDVVVTVGAYAFSDCTALKSVDLPMVTNIGGMAFYYCTALSTLVLRANTVVPLNSNNTFANTPIGNKSNGYIYVPSALVESYKTASFWRDYPNQFRALEDYTVDGTITGALDPTKI